jgi:hypothetical protein
MVGGRIGGLTCKPPISKREIEGGFLAIIGEVTTKTLPLHSTSHLLFIPK